MAKLPVYTPDQIAALAAYVASRGPGPAIPTADQLKTDAADLALGGELFRTNCSQCHAVSGHGGALSQGRYAPSLMKSEARRIYEAMITGPQSMPMFSDKTLTPSDKQAIIKYIKALQQEENPGGYGLGRLGTVTEGLFLWIFGIGALLGVAVWIGAKAK
jgi:ubiquinol-cytochrome c reductase cytochrome c subunit